MVLVYPNHMDIVITWRIVTVYACVYHSLEGSRFLGHHHGRDVVCCFID